MKKIGIITIIDYMNYGNRLQNYASQEVFKALGFTVETIININNSDEISRSKRENKYRYYIKMVFSEKWYDTLRIIFSRIFFFKKHKKLTHMYKLKKDNFKAFTNELIQEEEVYINETSNLHESINKYDYFVAGSDQIWNPLFRKGASADFLTFAPKHKRIAFSPSFGISEIPIEFHHNYKKWLNEMNSLSVREKAGAEIIKKLTGRKAEVLIDPTLMLPKEKWLSIAKESEFKPKEKFLLTYFLGEISTENKKEINKMSKEYNLKIINLASTSDKHLYTASPSEFIDFVNSATIFCTDSFHGVVFSILLETPVVVFKREGDLKSMNSRIETLLNTFHMENRLLSELKNSGMYIEADYTHIPKILEKEKKKVYNYLENSLGTIYSKVD